MIEGIPHVAYQLLFCGLTRSALALLDSVERGGVALNRLRAAGRRRDGVYSVDPAVYVPMVWADVAFPAPLTTSLLPETNSTFDERARDASESAFDAACAVVGVSNRDELPDVALNLLLPLDVGGNSIGLAAAIAYVAHLSGSKLAMPIFATGAVNSRGVVGAVDHLSLKVEGMLRELGEGEGLVFVPVTSENSWDDPRVIQVSRVSEAVQRIWGEDTLTVDSDLLSLTELIRTSRRERDHGRAIQILRGRSLDGRSPSDRARVEVELGTRLRHTGDSEAAMQLHEQVWERCAVLQDRLGWAVYEQMEIEALATELDRFEFDLAEKSLRSRLAKPFAHPHNEVRCRGMLAQVLSSVGKYDEAIALRLENLDRQPSMAEMRSEIPRTLAYLAYECARGGEQELFDLYVRRLWEATRASDVEQWRYNVSSLVRGLVLLGRDEALVRWLAGDGELDGLAVPRQLSELAADSGRIHSHPEVSTVRSLVRAYSKVGRNDRSDALSDRIAVDQDEPFLRWVALLGRAEHALALARNGRDAKARHVAAQTAVELAAAHPDASRAYRDLLAKLEQFNGAESERIESLLDAVYY